MHTKRNRAFWLLATALFFGTATLGMELEESYRHRLELAPFPGETLLVVGFAAIALLCAALAAVLYLSTRIRQGKAGWEAYKALRAREN